MMSKHCPCDTKKNYLACCGQYIVNQKIPVTAVDLMRSRYTAYTLLNIDYIQATMTGAASQDFNADDALEWAKLVKWRRLKIIDHYPDQSDVNRYYVEFVAHYIFNGIPQKLTEVSEFQKINSRWYYVDGNIDKEVSNESHYS